MHKVIIHTSHTLTGEVIDLTWLCYSEATGKVFCFICRLLSVSRSQLTKGFNDWKNSRACIESHSRSPQHIQALTDCTIRKNTNNRIDKSLVASFEKECSYWRKVLTRIVDILKVLCERDLALRGNNETIGPVHNGNFLGLVELLSEYDTFLATHIENHANKGTGHVSYLSHHIYEEIIQIMANKVMSVIIRELKVAKYFSISVDSTPDIKHVDQLSFTIR